MENKNATKKARNFDFSSLLTQTISDARATRTMNESGDLKQPTPYEGVGAEVWLLWKIYFTEEKMFKSCQKSDSDDDDEDVGPALPLGFVPEEKVIVDVSDTDTGFDDEVNHILKYNRSNLIRSRQRCFFLRTYFWAFFSKLFFKLFLAKC